MDAKRRLPVHTSPSQLESFALCNRKWFYEAVWGLYPPRDSGAQNRGTRVHKHLELRIKHGAFPTDDPETLPLAQALWPHVPLPEVPGLCEHRIDTGDVGALLAGWPVHGIIDRVIPPTDNTPPWIIDYKTLSRPTYALTAEALSTNVQLICYAMWAALHYSCRVVRVSHAYVITEPTKRDGHRAWRVDADLTVEHITAEWEKLSARARDMQAVAPLTRLPAQNKDACFRYGKCAQMTRCFRHEMPTEVKPMTISEKWKTQGQPVTLGDSGLVLYINAIPTKGPHRESAKPIEELVSLHNKALSTQLNVLDVGMVDYGKGTAALRGSIAAEGHKGVYYGPNTGLNAVAFEALRDQASIVVEGTR